MKNLTKILIPVLIVFAISCQKTETTPVDTTDYLPKILGSYNFKQKCGISPDEFNFTTITKSAAVNNGIELKNFGNFGGKIVNATVSGKNITIAKQIIDVGSAITITGTGTFDGTKTIDWNFTFSADGGISGACSSIGNKQ